ncbi:MAG: hypothetical protein JWM48_1439 [Mycobacterium sp.]|nr:hypothetical protein [Mycobacterium sp.]
MEVKTATDAAATELWKVANGSTQPVDAPGLRDLWSVAVRAGTSLQRVKRQLPDFLADLERDNMTAFIAGQDWSRVDRRERADSLGVQFASAHPAEKDVGAYVINVRQDPIWSGDADPVLGWLEDWIESEPSARNLRAKLARSGADERHAFIVLPAWSTAPVEVEWHIHGVTSPMPERAPVLPSELTHIWLVSVWGTTGIRWSPGVTDGKWERFSTKEPS